MSLGRWRFKVEGINYTVLPSYLAFGTTVFFWQQRKKKRKVTKSKLALAWATFVHSVSEAHLTLRALEKGTTMDNFDNSLGGLPQLDVEYCQRRIYCQLRTMQKLRNLKPLILETDSYCYPRPLKASF